MLKAFEIKKRSDGFWVPADAGIEHVARFMQDDVSTLTQIRYYLFAAVNAAVPGVYSLDWELSQLRTDAFARIDQRSDELIIAGFRFQDVVFSLSNEAQTRYITMMVTADYLSYPLDINSLDDNSKVTLVSADHTRQFCLTALVHVKGVVDSGTLQKDFIRATDDRDVIALFVDPRTPPSAMPQEPGESQSSQSSEEPPPEL
jgi:hypothetical protein